MLLQATSAQFTNNAQRVCGHFRRDWIIDEQQDAKEFLEFVLDFLHEDLNTAWDRHPLKELTDADELARERLPRQYAARIEWNRYLHRDNSLIGNLFAGQHASKLTCATCGTTSTKYEAFWSISVEIPHDRACDVRDCLRSYCSAEHLDTEDSWRCPRCKAPREATKKITITRAPDTLVIHFKRFSASRGESARKIRTPVYFPLQGLDIGPFMEPAITPEQESYVMGNARDADAQLTGLRTDPAMNGPYMYNAYAVIWHVGNTLGSGHYIAFVKDKAKGCWRAFNDERIHDFEPANLSEKDRLQNEKAYVVFYERERVAGGI
jgi:ubiquitin carboxyl-terminal hydrolase 8